ncbi:MAG: hypothetical protein Q8P76_02740, partial [bacterium]|nr:hypothetical protein [bacterium]
ATTSPSQLLSVHGNAFFSGSLINVANITATGTLTFVNASTTGMLTVDGGFISGASSTVVGNFSIAGVLRASSTATSTFAGGIKLSGGCFELADGTCAGSGGGLTVGGAITGGTGNRVLYEDSTNLLAESANLTFDGLTLVTARASTTGMFTIGTSFISSASSTIASSLHVSGQLYASSTLSVASLASLNGGFISVGSSTVAGNFHVSGVFNASSTALVNGLSTLTGGFISSASSTVTSGNLIVSAGSLGIGTTSPYARLVVKASPGSATRLVSVASSSDDIYFEISSTGTTTIDQLQTGVMTFETNAGVVTWVDLPVTSDSAFGTIQSYSAMIDASSTLTVYGESNGAGGIIRQKVGIGTSTPWGILSVERTTATTSPMFVVSSQSTGTPYFIISDRGYVGIGTSSPGFPLSVFGNIGVMSCIKGATTSQSTIFGPGDCSDIAESYLAGETLEPGDLVALDENSPISLVKAIKTSKLILGAISAHPAVLFEGNLSSFGAPDVQDQYMEGEKAPLAVVGRILVKVNLEGGEIKAGDPIAASSEPGIGQKATSSGMIIGYALEDYLGPTAENKGMVSMLVSLGNWQAPVNLTSDVQNIGGNSGTSEVQNIVAVIIDAVKSWLESLQVYIENGLGRLKEFVAEKITAKKGTFDRVELKDESGQIYCVQIQSGSLISVAGECPESSSAPEPAAEPTE